MNRRTILCVLLCCFSSVLKAQQIEGDVVDVQGQPLSFASVALLHPVDSSLVSGVMADINGHFSIQGKIDQQTFLLRVSSVSYETVFMKVDKETSNLKIVMNDNTIEYASVIVSGKRPFSKRVGDKVVFNPQLMNNIDAMQANDVLKYAPGVVVEKDKVSFNGKDAALLINGRVMGSEEAMDYLSNLNATDIERIEIRQNSGGLYSSTIQGGLINIVTKKNLLGLRGTASMYSDTKFHDSYTLSPNANIFFGTQKWNLYASYKYTQFRAKSNTEMTNDFLYNGSTHFSNIDALSCLKKHNYRLGSVFNISDNHRLSLEINGSHMPWRPDAMDSNELLTLANGNSYTATQHSKSPSKSDFYNIAGAYHWELDSLNSSFNLLTNYNKIKTRQEDNLMTTYPLLPSNNVHEIDNDYMSADNISIKADLEKHWANEWTLTAGGAYSTSKRFNETNFNYLIDNTNSYNSWNYREHIGAGYLGVEKKFGHFYAIGRMRLEHTNLNGHTTSSDNVKWKTTDIIPYAFLSYSTESGWTFSTSYTRNTRRPAFSQLSGYMTRYNDVLYEMGNPNLKHDITEHVDLTINKKQHTLTFEFESTPNAMITTIESQNGISYIQEQNKGKRRYVTGIYTYGGNLFSWWQTNAMAELVYINYPESFNQKSLWFGFFSWVNRFSWERIGTFELSAHYTTKVLEGNITMKRKTALLYFSYERNLGKNFIVSAGVNDILNGGRVHTVNKSPTLVFDFKQNNFNPEYWCKLTYKFGNKRKTQTNQLENENDIIDRMK